MTDLTLVFDKETLALATQQALLGILNEEAKQKLIESAIQNILQEKGIYSNKSKLMEIFENATYNIVREKVKNMLETDEEFKLKINEFLSRTLLKVMQNTEARLDERLATALVDAITQR